MITNVNKKCLNLFIYNRAVYYRRNLISLIIYTGYFCVIFRIILFNNIQVIAGKFPQNTKCICYVLNKKKLILY